MLLFSNSSLWFSTQTAGTLTGIGLKRNVKQKSQPLSWQQALTCPTLAPSWPSPWPRPSCCCRRERRATRQLKKKWIKGLFLGRFSILVQMAFYTILGTMFVQFQVHKDLKHGTKYKKWPRWKTNTPFMKDPIHENSYGHKLWSD